MRCLICEVFWRFIDSDPPGWVATYRRELGPDWVAGNGDALWAKEHEPDRLRAAYALWNSDPGRAFREFLACAEAGSVWSMSQVAWAYSEGKGTAVDLSAAEAWNRRAFEGGSDNAMLCLAARYHPAEAFRRCRGRAAVRCRAARCRCPLPACDRASEAVSRPRGPADCTRTAEESVRAGASPFQTPACEPLSPRSVRAAVHSARSEAGAGRFLLTSTNWHAPATAPAWRLPRSSS